jgi:hypothetical protein
MKKQKEDAIAKVSKLLRERRRHYLGSRHGCVQDTFAKRRVDKRSTTKDLSSIGPFQLLAILHLKREIEIAKSDILGLKLRAKSQDLRGLPADEEPVAAEDEPLAAEEDAFTAEEEAFPAEDDAFAAEEETLAEPEPNFLGSL